ncbi:gamma-glutamyltransferase family protein [Poseidonocella sp. HB161398]|uniref:gamma-glutamyltransferase family protein n=1 Tax=Poseidonocella sp. HB161398 TaxID=2320855 RepID=UPI0011081B96|nr:gamma-glutamyltransferase family protein [Poseidonocella sp. HB161398]
MRNFHLPGRSPVFAANGICATSHPLASHTAVAILEAGGSAVDAAIAAATVLGLAEPQMAGLGGDCFALVKPPGTEEVIALNGSGRAPAGLSAEALRAAGHRSMPLHDAASVTVPGAVDAFCHMHDAWGKLELGAVLAPAIRYAEEGIPVAPRVAHDWGLDGGVLQGVARDLYLPDGTAPPTGRIFRAPRQAELLRRIAAHGRDAFYTGEVAEDMVAALRAAGGCHVLEDFAATKTSRSVPISGRYWDVELLEHAPNGQGATAILMTNILNRFDLAENDPLDPWRAHLEVEATKLAYDARDRFLADPDHVRRLEHMLSDETAGRLAGLIDEEKANPMALEQAGAVHRDTVYLCVVDRDLMAVSLIFSIFHSFGSGIASPEFGILFQNRGAGFSLEPGHPNEAAGGKRPMHTIIPAMLREGGRLSTVFGVMGGAYQPVGHVRFLTNLTDFGMPLQAAIDAPRCFWENGKVMLEDGYPRGVGMELGYMGHEVGYRERPLGGAQAIRIDYAKGVFEGASDPRKDGCALGW